MPQTECKTLSNIFSSNATVLLSGASLAFNYSSAPNHTSHSRVDAINQILSRSRLWRSMVSATSLIGSNLGFAVLISQFVRAACAGAQASLPVNCVCRVSNITSRSSLLRSLRSLHGTPRKRGAP